MAKLFALSAIFLLLSGCATTQPYKYKATKLKNVTVIRYQEMADNFKHISFDRFNSILTVTYQLPATNLVWEESLIDLRSKQLLCEEKSNTIYQLARKDKLGIRFIYAGDGGKVVGPWASDICQQS